MRVDNAKAENSTEELNDSNIDVSETVHKTKNQTTNTNENEVADVLTFLLIFSAFYFPPALVLATLSLHSLLVPLAIAVSFAVFYSKS